MNKPIFVLHNQDLHFWYSCNVIVAAVKEAFEGVAGVTWCSANSGLNATDIAAIRLSASMQETFIYLVSDNLNYQQIAQELQEIENIVFIIPVYGNMTVEFDRWPALSNLLRSKKVILLVASHRSGQQISLFVESATIKKIPYPVSLLHFHDTPALPPESTIQLVYSGRLMIQKNVFELMNTFLLAHKMDPRLRLNICGEFHERSHHLHGIEVDFAMYRQEFHRIIDSGGGAIIYHGFLDQTQLQSLNAQCDYVISMSTYHDEDFGVSVAQALAQGLRPILSDWGGHPDFVRAFSGTLIPVKLNQHKVPNIVPKHLLLALEGLKPLSSHTRERNRKIAQGMFSVKAFRENFLRLLSTPVKTYEGQNSFYLNYAKVCSSRYPFYKYKKFEPVEYLDIYKSYLSDYQDLSQFSLDAPHSQEVSHND